VQGVQFFRYELWVRRGHDVPWQALIPSIEQALWRHWGSVDVRPWSPDRRYVTVDRPSLDVAKPLVFEGVAAAQAHPLARALFAIDGVAEVLCQQAQIRIRKGAAFDWEEMRPQIDAALARFSHD
jgi:hypothetical protein